MASKTLAVTLCISNSVESAKNDENDENRGVQKNKQKRGLDFDRKKG